MSENNKKVMNEFWEWVHGVILGTALGITGTRAYQAHFAEPTTKQSQVITLLRASSSLSCAEGKQEVIAVVIGEKTAKEAVSCEDVAEKWVKIYKGEK